MKKTYKIKCSAIVTKEIEVNGESVEESKRFAEQIGRQWLYDHDLDDVDTAFKWDGNMSIEIIG